MATGKFHFRYSSTFFHILPLGCGWAVLGAVHVQNTRSVARRCLSSLRAFALLLLELLNVQLKASNRVINKLMNIVGAQELLVTQRTLETGESLVDMFEFRLVDGDHVVPAVVVTKFVSRS